MMQQVESNLGKMKQKIIFYNYNFMKHIGVLKQRVNEEITEHIYTN